jgi:hypothetical protein
MIELHFRDQHDQNAHYDKMRRGEKGPVMSLLDIMYMILEVRILCLTQYLVTRQWNQIQRVECWHQDRWGDEGLGLQC